MLQLEICLLLCMIHFLPTSQLCLPNNTISGFKFGNNFTNVYTTQHWTVYHFEEQLNSSDKVIFSSYGHISSSDGINERSLRNSQIIAGGNKDYGYREGKGTHAHFRSITDFCQNGTHIIAVDHGNHCIRSINYNNGCGDNSTATLAGRCDNSGYTDGDVLSALFNKPHSILIMKRGNNSLYLVTDSGNNAIRIIDTDKGEVSTFVESSDHLIAPIDLVISQDLSTLYVTTRTGLTIVDILSRQTRVVQDSGSMHVGKLYKIAPLIKGSYLIADRTHNELIVFDANAVKFLTICCRNVSNSSNPENKCRLHKPYSVFFSRRKSAILVGAHKHLKWMSISEISNTSTNQEQLIPDWIWRATSTSTAIVTDNSTTESFPGDVTSEGLVRDDNAKLFAVYGFLSGVVLLFFVIFALQCQQVLQRTRTTKRNEYNYGRSMYRPLPVRPRAQNSIATTGTLYDHIDLRSSGLSSASGTNTNNSCNVSNGSPIVPMRTNRRYTIDYMPMGPSHTEYAPMNNAVYQNDQSQVTARLLRALN